jgi:hypothetical protein
MFAAVMARWRRSALRLLLMNGRQRNARIDQCESLPALLLRGTRKMRQEQGTTVAGHVSSAALLLRLMDVTDGGTRNHQEFKPSPGIQASTPSRAGSLPPWRSAADAVGREAFRDSRLATHLLHPTRDPGPPVRCACPYCRAHSPWKYGACASTWAHFP